MPCAFRYSGSVVARATGKHYLETYLDHAPLPSALLARLRAAAERAGAALATTEKDAARLPAAERDGVAVLPLELTWADGADDALEALLGPLVRRAQESEEASTA